MEFVRNSKLFIVAFSLWLSHITYTFHCVHFVLKFAELSFQKWGSNSTKELGVDIYLYLFSLFFLSFGIRTQKMQPKKFISDFLFCVCACWTYWNTDQLIMVVVVAVVWFLNAFPKYFTLSVVFVRLIFLCLPTHFSRTDSITYTYFIWLKRRDHNGNMEKEEKKRKKNAPNEKCWSLFFELIFGCTCTISIVAFFGQFKKWKEHKCRIVFHVRACVRFFSFTALCLRFSLATMANITCNAISSYFIRCLCRFSLYTNLLHFSFGSFGLEEKRSSCTAEKGRKVFRTEEEEPAMIWNKKKMLKFP